MLGSSFHLFVLYWRLFYEHLVYSGNTCLGTACFVIVHFRLITHVGRLWTFRMFTSIFGCNAQAGTVGPNQARRTFCICLNQGNGCFLSILFHRVFILVHICALFWQHFGWIVTEANCQIYGCFVQNFSLMEDTAGYAKNSCSLRTKWCEDCIKNRCAMYPLLFLAFRSKLDCALLWGFEVLIGTWEAFFTNRTVSRRLTSPGPGVEHLVVTTP